MTRRRRHVYAISLFAFIALAVPLFAGKPAPPPSTPDIPVTVTMRCPSTTNCVSTDRIAGDFYGDYCCDLTKYFLNTDGGHGALRMYFNLPRTFRLDFTQQDGVAPCLSTRTGCKRNFAIVDVPSPSPGTAVNPTDANDVELPNGFLSIPVGGFAYSRIKINFPDPSGRGYLWTVRFNSGAYPGSTNVMIRRISESTWEVEATEADRARLVCSTGGGKLIDEGLFIMPFKMTVVK